MYFRMLKQISPRARRENAPSTTPLAILTEDLTKSYKAGRFWGSSKRGLVMAVRGVDLIVPVGTVLTMLGPNGAGKTTFLHMLAGLMAPSSGRVLVFGRSPLRADRALRQRRAVMLQSSGIEPYVYAEEVLRHHARLYRDPRPVEPLMDLLGLNRRLVVARKLSGGERRRLELALALVGNPELLVLDEPVTGLDPESRRACWAAISEAKNTGTTIVLSTHHVDEAVVLSDAVAIMNRGRIIAAGSPTQLLAEQPSEIRWRDDDPLEARWPVLPPGALVRREGPNWIVSTHHVVPTLNAVVSWAASQCRPLAQLAVIPPRLEDVFLEAIRADLARQSS